MLPKHLMYKHVDFIVAFILDILFYVYIIFILSITCYKISLLNETFIILFKEKLIAFNTNL